MHQKKHLIVIGGATATGKTTAAIRSARHFDTEIISADSRQFYREMSIGTAKQTEEELATVPHHLVNSLSIEQPYSVGDFERDVLKVLDKIFASKNVAVMAGGSGLFIRAVCEGLDSFPDVPEAIQQEVQLLWETNGIEALQTELARLDPEYFEQVDRKNPVRLIRAIAVCRASGQPFSSFRKGKKNKRNFTPIYLLLEMERERLYERINLRVDKMMEAGLLEEARKLFPQRHFNSLQTVGYQELFDFFESKTSLEEAVELIKRNSRRYAKRQMTWFRKRPHWTVFEPNDYPAMVEYVEQNLAV